MIRPSLFLSLECRSFATPTSYQAPPYVFRSCQRPSQVCLCCEGRVGAVGGVAGAEAKRGEEVALAPSRICDKLSLSVKKTTLPLFSPSPLHPPTSLPLPFLSSTSHVFCSSLFSSSFLSSLQRYSSPLFFSLSSSPSSCFFVIHCLFLLLLYTIFVSMYLREL